MGSKADLVRPVCTKCWRRGSRFSSPGGGGLGVGEVGCEPRVGGDACDELLHAHSLGDLDAVHLEDVLLARARLNEAVIAVGADVGLLTRVDLQIIHQRQNHSMIIIVSSSQLN